jgi:hypothetical protein
MVIHQLADPNIHTCLYSVYYMDISYYKLTFDSRIGIF